MKFLRQTLLMAFFGLGLALTASAQPPDRKKPPKEKPPEIKPEDKRPPKNNDNNDRRNNDKKKPQVYFLLSENRISISSK